MTPNKHKQRQALGVITGIGVGIALVLVLTMLVRTWTLADAIRSGQENDKTVLHVIKDCTQPTGDCYRNGQKRTADVVSNINRVAIYAAACASRPKMRGDVARIQACVLNRVEQDTNNEKLNNHIK